MFCPDTESKSCIFGQCVAYEAGISMMQCTICDETFQLGSSCNEINHQRTPIFLSEAPGYCQKYKTKIHQVHQTQQKD